MSGDHLKGDKIQRNALAKRGYTVTERIGHGGFGVVMTARSTRHHSRMAIKVIEKCWYGVPDVGLQQSIDNEKQFADKFDHPYINVYHEIIETSKRAYMVMDFYPDGTLSDYFAEVDHTAEPVAYEWFAQLCSALEYVHARGFAHRDVKMDNVLLDRQSNIRLADFGLCVAVDPESAASRRAAVNRTVCGTPMYMSPEQLSRVPYNAQSADVWAAGVLLFCLVAGRFPFTYPDPGTDGVNDKKAQVLNSQKNGYSFNPDEKQRLSVECQSIFKNIFINEPARNEIKDLKKEKWMVNGAQNI